MLDLAKFLFVFLVLAAGSLSWAENNGHKPTKAIPILIGYVVFSAIAYFVIHQFSGTPSYVDLLNREAIIEALAGWIIVAMVAGLCFLFILRMLMKSQERHIGEAE